MDVLVLEEVAVAVVRDADWAWILFRVEGWRTQVRYTAVIAMRCGGYSRHRSDRYVSLIINLRFVSLKTIDRLWSHQAI